MSGKCTLIPTCTGNTYLNATNNTCLQCPVGCSFCSMVLTTGILNCTACSSHYYPFASSNTTTSATACQKCPDNCNECQYNSMNSVAYCTSCPMNQGLNDVLGSCQNCNTGCSSCELSNRQIDNSGSITTLKNYMGNAFNLSSGINSNCIFCQSNSYYYSQVHFLILLKF